MSIDNESIPSPLINIYNPLIDAAKPIFALANAMNSTTTNLSTEKVLHKFSELLDEFEEQSEKNRATFDVIKAGKYCLCAFIDETAVRSGWSNEEWSSSSLLVKTFNETWGGERFFEILENAKENIEKNLFLLELIYLCLHFGYRGKFQIRKDGDLGIESERNILYKIIGENRPNVFNSMFSESSDNKELANDNSKVKIPVWVISILCALLVAIVFTVLQWSLGNKFDVVSSKINRLSLPKITAYKAKSIQVKNHVQAVKLEPQLRNLIEKKYITVADYDDRSVITILGDGLYESGSEVINDEYYGVFAVIGQELNDTEGKIVISGYTDNNPIKSLAYPSNWHLSQARADSVRKILVDKNNAYIEEKSRIRSEGMGESNPVAPNDTPENKAKNRRVEITLYHGGKPSTEPKVKEQKVNNNAKLAK